jgi:hypothetical protein
MWMNHFARGEGMIFTTVYSHIVQERISKTPPCPAAPGSKSTARKIVKELPHFRDAASALLSGIPT